MRSHRLGRLAALTQGVALVGFGLAGCGEDKPPVTPATPEHVNAPTPPTSSSADAPVESPKTPVESPKTPEPPKAPEHVNSPPPQPSGSASAPRVPKRVNSAPEVKKGP